MFELEELYDLLQEGAFESQEEFLSFAEGLSHEELFELMQEGAFADLEEFKKTVNLKKTTKKSMNGLSHYPLTADYFLPDVQI